MSLWPSSKGRQSLRFLFFFLNFFVKNLNTIFSGECRNCNKNVTHLIIFESGIRPISFTLEFLWTRLYNGDLNFQWTSINVNSFMFIIKSNSLLCLLRLLCVYDWNDIVMLINSNMKIKSTEGKLSYILYNQKMNRCPN